MKIPKKPKSRKKAKKEIYNLQLQLQEKL